MRVLLGWTVAVAGACLFAAPLAAQSNVDIRGRATATTPQPATPLKSDQSKPAAPTTGPVPVEFAQPYEPGSIVIVNSERKLYYVTERGRALRYGVAVGNPDEVWVGRQFITSKKENPRWVSPDDDEWNYEGGDPANPLGVRAMYLGWSLWRIHGTPNPKSIGRNVSNGCIRMRNDDVVDLFDRVHIGAPVYAVDKLDDARPQQWARKVSDD